MNKRKKKKINNKLILIIIAILIVVCIIIFNKNKVGNTSVQTENYASNEQSNVTENSTLENALVQNVVTENIINQNKIIENAIIKNEINEEKKAKYPTGKTPYYIKVNYQENAVTVYKKDKNGYYSEPVKAMICSCGKSTPKSGVYKTSKGYEWGFLEGGTFGRYSTVIKGDILFHSVPYLKQTEDSLEYWEYDKLGTTASLGCVRLSVVDCKWIFDNIEAGTGVEFYADSNPGPLGKPIAKKISDNEECRNWDPTDESPNSPWNK